MAPQTSEAFGERNTELRAARTHQTEGTAAGEKHCRLRVRAAEHYLSLRDSSAPRQDEPHGPHRAPARRRARAERGAGARGAAGRQSTESWERHRRPHRSPLPARAARLCSAPSRGPGGVARQRGAHTAAGPSAMAAGPRLTRRRRRQAREWSLAGARRAAPRVPGGVPGGWLPPASLGRTSARDEGGKAQPHRALRPPRRFSLPPSLPSGSAARSRPLSDPRPRAIPNCQVPQVKPAHTDGRGTLSSAAA